MLTKILIKIKTVVQLNPQIAESVEDFLVHNYYLFLVILLFVSIASLVFSAKYIFREFKKISVKSWLIIILLFNLALIVRFFILQHHPQVFFDEVTFIETAENYFTGGLNLQNFLGPLRNRFLICTTGWPFLVSLGFRFTGINVKTAFYLSGLLSSLTVVFVFLTGTLMFKSEKAGLWSAFIFSLYPVFLRLSTSSAMGTSSIFFVFLTLTAFILYFKQRKVSLLYFSFSCLGWVSNIRQEAILTLLPLLLLFFLIFHPDKKKEFKNMHFYICLIMTLFFALPAALASFYGVSTGFYFFYETPQQMNTDILYNVKYNLLYWIANRIQPLSIVLMAIFSFIMFFRVDRKLCLYFAGWFGFLYVFYTMNPSCDFSAVRTLDSWRNVFHLLVPVILFAGIAPPLILEYFRENYKKLQPIAFILLIVMVLSIPIQFRKFIEFKTIYARENLFIKKFTHLLPKDSKIIVDGRMQPAVRESYMSMFSYTSPIPGEYYEVDPYTPLTMRKLLRDLNRWRNQEKKPVFIYFSNFNNGSLNTDYKWYFDTFKLKMITGFGSSEHNTSFALYEIVGIKRLPSFTNESENFERDLPINNENREGHIDFIIQDSETNKKKNEKQMKPEKKINDRILPDYPEDAF